MTKVEGPLTSRLTIGTRGSKLALAQTYWVREQILRQFPGRPIEIRTIKTSADWDTQTPIRAGSGKGVFVKEIEEALLNREIDLAVHSMKDVPTEIPYLLDISIIPMREDARDALITLDNKQNMGSLPAGAVVGTGSARRQAQILAMRSDLKILDIRGNVDTRLRKLQDGKYDAIVLACAGLHRLGLTERITSRLELSEMLPAPGQGALALQTRKDDAQVRSMIQFLNHPPTASAVLAERVFLKHVGGGCNSPVAVHACVSNGVGRIDGLVATPDGRKVLRESLVEKAERIEETALSLADKILTMGGRAILRAVH